MSTVSAPPPAPALHSETLLRRFLAAYWLRPENAFWMTIRSMLLGRVELTSPSIDLCCGDGLFTFLHAGGTLSPEFDVFHAVGNLDQVSRQHADMFDVPDAHYDPQVTRPPLGQVDVGCDLKPNLLAKASTLGLYRSLVQHDSNQPLPFDDQAFATIYCNAIYWLTNIDAALRELHRVLRPDGRIVLQVKLATLDNHTLTSTAPQLGPAALDVIGRGRRACWPTVATADGWEERFAAADLAIVDRAPLATGAHARIWDIGLRPIAPLLVRMANGLTPANRSAIKADWLDLLEPLLAPLATPDLAFGPDSDEPVEMQYVLERRGAA